MIITNKTNLLESLYEAIVGDDYDNGGVWRSATELVAAPQKVFLARKHDAEIVEDAQDLFHRFLGTMAHLVVERAAQRLNVKYPGQWISEQRLFAKVEGKEISGALDLFHIPTGTLVDIKTCSYAEVKYKRAIKPTWRGQGMILKHLLAVEGIEVKRILFQRILRDWSKSALNRETEAAMARGFDCDYPRYPFVDVDMELISKEDCLSYLTDRVKRHLAYENGEDVPCTPEERYAKPDSYSVMNGKNPRAVANMTFTDKEAAKAAAHKLGGLHWVRFKPASNDACKMYCSVNKFCSQFKAMSILSTATKDINPNSRIGGA